ncbi:hypothetical protein M2167_003193 [Streptomyces sp. SPB4]|nr:hypothetical protein [Streptomyces sp. SPB4]
MGLTPEMWQAHDVTAKREAIGSVVDAVVVRPVPKGRPRNAPFDPGLIEVVLKPTAPVGRPC